MKKKLSLIGIAIVLALSLVMVVAAPASAAVTGVVILAPTAASPVSTTTGGSVEVTAAITVGSDDYYTVTISVCEFDTGAITIPPAVADIEGQYTDLVYLTTGTTVLTRMVSLGVGIDASAATVPLGVVVSVDNAYGTEGTDYAVAGDLTATPPEIPVGVIEIPGTTLTTTLIGKSVIIVESVLDKFIAPGSFNEALRTGDAPAALESQGTQLVDGLTGIALGGVDVAGEGVTVAGEILTAIHGAVATKVPTIANGALSLVAEIVSLFSTTAPLAPAGS